MLRFQRWPKNGSDSTMKITCVCAPRKLSIAGLERYPGRIGRLFQLQWQVFFAYSAEGAQAKMSTWFSKPNQSLISKVTKKRVGFNLKIFVCLRAPENCLYCRAGADILDDIGRLFKLQWQVLWAFHAWRVGAQAKMSKLSVLVSPIKVWLRKVTRPKVCRIQPWKLPVFALLENCPLYWLERTSWTYWAAISTAMTGVFCIWREAPKAKCLPGLVSPIKVWFQRWPKKGSDSTWKFLYVCAPEKLSIAGLERTSWTILGDYLNCNDRFFGRFMHGG